MVGRKEVKDMGDIMRKLNGVFGTEDTNSTADNPSPSLNEGYDDSDRKKDMSNIMSKLKGLVDNTRDESASNDILFEALQTEKTETGVRVGGWEISTRTFGKSKYYDIYQDDVIIASDLRLYEAAKQLVEHLNKGDSITSPKIQRVIGLENTYASKLEEAKRHYKTMIKNTGSKQSIAKARFDESKASALRAKKSLYKS